MNELPWFPFYVDRFLGSRRVRRMNAEQIGAFVLLMCEQWEGGPIPDDDDELARFTHAPASIARGVLEQCFDQTPEGWVNPELAEIQGEQQARRTRRAKAGAKGGKKRAANRQAMLEQEPSNTQASIEEESREEEKKEETEDAPEGLVVEESFHNVWCEVTAHPKAQLSPTRAKRYRDTARDMKRAGVEPLVSQMRLWTVILNAIWSEPWRRKKMNGHDSKNILRDPEQRESWIETGITELNAGRDGTGYHERINGEPTKESADDSRKRSAILERSQVADEEREAAEDAKAQEEIAKATRWFRALTEAAQKEVDAEVTERLTRDFPGVPESKILRKSIFLTIHKERSAA